MLIRRGQTQYRLVSLTTVVGDLKRLFVRVVHGNRLRTGSRRPGLDEGASPGGRPIANDQLSTTRRRSDPITGQCFGQPWPQRRFRLRSPQSRALRDTGTGTTKAQTQRRKGHQNHSSHTKPPATQLDAPNRGEEAKQLGRRIIPQQGNDNRGSAATYSPRGIRNAKPPPATNALGNSFRPPMTRSPSSSRSS